ncbi:hypothetical protein AD945_06210 [Gluconobacter albidus]|uniref:Uncharacterized protein n=1 Tax=Gluconobacter albidus TaxID=318683 RepID=A0A149TK41_9PROT|nr:hypothetical protein [Gluconobacter albidus]KXV48740.1 hypothetical protein AD945_06210 [Gluconobacter albidus]
MTARHDWSPYIPEVETMLRAGKTRREIASHLGVKETSLSSMIGRHGLAGLSPNGSATGGSSPQNTHNRIDWAPLMPALLEMMERVESATVIAKKLGVSPASLSAAMERQVPKAIRTKWKKARQEATHPKKERAEPVLRDPLEPFSDVSWRALFDGNPPPVPDCAFGRDRGLH